MKYIGVGYSPIHYDRFKELGIVPSGFLETGPVLSLCNTFEEAAALQPDFWDVTRAVKGHLRTLEIIISLDPFANILIENPLCAEEEIEKLENLLKDFKGKIILIDPDLYSTTTKKMQKILRELKLEITKISIDLHQNYSLFPDGAPVSSILEDFVPNHSSEARVVSRSFTSSHSQIKYLAGGLIVSISASTMNSSSVSDPVATLKCRNYKGEPLTLVGEYGYPDIVRIFKNKRIVAETTTSQDTILGKHLILSFDYLSALTNLTLTPKTYAKL